MPAEVIDEPSPLAAVSWDAGDDELRVCYVRLVKWETIMAKRALLNVRTDALPTCRHAEAVPLCERGVAALEAALGPNNANVASALMLQVRVLTCAPALQAVAGMLCIQLLPETSLAALGVCVQATI